MNNSDLLGLLQFFTVTFIVTLYLHVDSEREETLVKGGFYSLQQSHVPNRSSENITIQNAFSDVVTWEIGLASSTKVFMKHFLVTVTSFSDEFCRMSMHNSYSVAEKIE